jgi:A/G-specific adenine glycosylase
MGRVEDFPAPRPRRPLLLRTTGMLVLVWDTELLLERRPPAGIWGGLWCLPEIGLPPDTSEHAMVSAIARERFACEIERVKRLPTLRHGFTAGEADVLWHALADVRDAAVPSPVKRIAQGIVSL